LNQAGALERDLILDLIRSSPVSQDFSEVFAKYQPIVKDGIPQFAPSRLQDPDFLTFLSDRYLYRTGYKVNKVYLDDYREQANAISAAVHDESAVFDDPMQLLRTGMMDLNAARTDRLFRTNKGNPSKRISGPLGRGLFYDSASDRPPVDNGIVVIDHTKSHSVYSLVNAKRVYNFSRCPDRMCALNSPQINVEDLSECDRAFISRVRFDTASAVRMTGTGSKSLGYSFAEPVATYKDTLEAIEKLQLRGFAGEIVMRFVFHQNLDYANLAEVLTGYSVRLYNKARLHNSVATLIATRHEDPDFDCLSQFLSIVGRIGVCISAANALRTVVDNAGLTKGDVSGFRISLAKSSHSQTFATHQAYSLSASHVGSTLLNSLSPVMRGGIISYNMISTAIDKSARVFERTFKPVPVMALERLYLSTQDTPSMEFLLSANQEQATKVPAMAERSGADLLDVLKEFNGIGRSASQLASAFAYYCRDSTALSVKDLRIP